MSACPSCQREIAAGSRFCPACGAATVTTGGFTADPWLGQVVNRKFRVEALIGQGGMGRVYKATHLTLDKPVVMKMLHKGLTSSDPSVAARFHREAKAASRLVHANSIQVLDFGEAEDGTLFMAMEYLQGRDLAYLLAEAGPLPEERIVRIGAQILAALSEAHANGIIHRDLKPENVMIEDRRNEPDHVTVLDFGIAKISDPGPGEGKLTQAGLVCGTPQYMSPEQARGRELDARSDLYAMGVILYQMATARLPFESDTPVGFLTKHISEPPAPLREKNPALRISARLEDLIARSLAKDPDGRPASADVMRSELLACLKPQSAPAPTRPVAPAAPTLKQAPAPEPPAPPPGKSSALLISAAVVVVVVAGGAGAWFALRPKPSPPAPAVAAASPVRNPPAGPGAAPSPVAPAPAAPAATPALTPTSAAMPTATAAPRPGPDTVAVAAEPMRDPKRARALFDQAEAKRRNMDTSAAIALYLRAEQADPDLAEIQKKLGQCYQLAGDIPRARDRYRKYLATRPPDADKIKASLEMLR